MEKCSDFLQLLDHDMSMAILSYLDDPSDIVRVSSVSRSWRQFVIANDLCKKLFLRLFPEVASASNAIEVNSVIDAIEVWSNNSEELGSLERNHRVYAFLARGLAPIMRKDCILEAISASSTDNYPDESIQNTLEPRDRVEEKASYWSSEGESDPTVPETLTYRLISKLCFITEINIQPFQAYFQYGFPIYSAKAVRFRMGHLNSPLGIGRLLMDELAAGQKSVHDYVSWTYISPEFPMAQENRLQKFKLPEPVLCIGGILQIELLGRVQRQEMDELFYICVSHVQVVGRPLSPAFDAEVIDHQSGKCVLKYCPDAENSTSSSRAAVDEAGEPSGLHRFMQRTGWNWERMILNTLLGNPVVDDDNDDNGDNESEYNKSDDESHT